MNAKIKSILFATALASCGSTAEFETCNLNTNYSFNFEQSQYFGLPIIDFTFSVNDSWSIKMPEWGVQNFSYYEIARYNDDSSGSILIKIHPFRREGSYITINEQTKAQEHINTQFAKRESWKTLKSDTIANWMVQYGIYEQEPIPYVIAHKLMLRDTLSNGLFLELQMPCPMDSFALDRQSCLDAVMESFKIYL